MNLFKKILKEYQTQKRYTSSMINALLEIFFICLLRNHEKNMIVPNPAGKKQEKNIILYWNISNYIMQPLRSRNYLRFLITANDN